jgi:hypothetical protein
MVWSMTGQSLFNMVWPRFLNGQSGLDSGIRPFSVEDYVCIEDTNPTTLHPEDNGSRVYASNRVEKWLDISRFRHIKLITWSVTWLSIYLVEPQKSKWSICSGASDQIDQIFLFTGKGRVVCRMSILDYFMEEKIHQAPWLEKSRR